MFRGRYEHAIDAKGRTSFPAAFREVLNTKGDARLVVTTGLEACLVAYPMSEWLAFEERLAQLPQFDRSVAMLRRIYVSGAVECEVDKVGRLLIPAGCASTQTLAARRCGPVWAATSSCGTSGRSRACVTERSRPKTSVRPWPSGSRSWGCERIQPRPGAL
ncbi:MAG: division/cell wall cluster transcriptional repressor MraZ [Sandaracinaceae bacterium]|nr:division/cell wall cluster transcriptional repressor MraZ [Sandaracinaceae bacterium]